MAGKGINRSIILKINGKEVEHSVYNVQKIMRELTKEVNKATRGSEEYVKTSAELRKVTAYYKEMKQEITGLPTLFDKVSEKAKGIVAILGVGVGLVQFKNGIQQLIDLSAELADKQADVRKTTGMTKEEVRALTQELDKLETRTSRADLLSIAEEGGRIGIAKEEIAAFTEAMNKANVALGDTFGSASEVANVLGKLRFLYKETSEMGVSDAYNKIGSALNELGANGVASEQNIAAFATRVGALPNAFKPSIADAMALGAAFEESGVNAEVAGRSYGILIQTAANNTAAFAKQMNMTKAEVEALINSNPTEFFLQFSKSLSGMDANGVRMAKVLKELGVGADGVNKIIGAASANNDRFRESIALSNQAMIEGTSLTDEYAVKNENLAATIEKIQKRFVELIDADWVQDFVEGLVEWFGRLIGAIDNTEESTSSWVKKLQFATKVVGVLLASFVSYTAAVRLATLFTNQHTKAVGLQAVADKGAALAKKAWTIVASSASVIMNTLTGRTFAAARAQVALNMATKANPWGLALGALTAVVSAIAIFAKETNKAADAQTKFSEKIKEVNESVGASVDETAGKISRLINVIKDENVNIEIRKKAYEDLIAIAPEFNGYLEDEKFNIEGLTAAYHNYIDGLYAVGRAKSIIKLNQDVIDDEVKAWNRLNEAQRRYTEVFADGYQAKKRWYEDMVDARYRERKAARKELEEAQKAYDLSVGMRERTGEYIKEDIVSLEKRASYLSKFIKINFGHLADEEKMKLQSYVDSVAELRNIEKQLEILTGKRKNPDDGKPTNNYTADQEKKEKEKHDPEPERRQKIADELIKIEIEKNRRLRDLELANRKERAQLMADGWAKEVELLDIERQEKLNKLKDELEDLARLKDEYRRRANEETKKGNTAGASGFNKQADEIVKIEEERKATLLIVEQTHQDKIQTLKLTNLKKQTDDQQKAYERRLMKLKTDQNNELKAITDLESAKEVLRNEYGYTDEQLKKVKDFEKAKSTVVLEQQKVTAKLQSDQLQEQIKQLKGVLNADEAFEGSVWGKIFNEDQREEILEWLEVLQNKLSEIQNPDQEEIDAENKKLASFIDIFGFSADEWQLAFDNLDTMSGKLALVQMGVQAMSNAWGMFYSMQQANMKRDLDRYTAATNRKKEALKQQLDEGYISEATYNAKIAKMDADLEKKRAQMEYKTAMAEWKQSLLQAATNTAVGVTAALAMTPPNFVIAGIVGGMGAIQAGLIAANKPSKPEGYFSGGATSGSGRYDSFGRELADGPIHANEYVIPEYLRRDPQIARMEEFIEARRKGMSPTTSPNETAERRSDGSVGLAPVVVNADNSNQELTGAVRELIGLVADLRDKPIKAELTRTMQVAKYISDDLEDYKNHREKNKR